MEKQTGIVKWFNPAKGYGFIYPDKPVEGLAPNEQLFVHARHIIPAHEGGQRLIVDYERVEFVVAEGRRGVEAREVRVIE